MLGHRSLPQFPPLYHEDSSGPHLEAGRKGKHIKCLEHDPAQGSPANSGSSVVTMAEPGVGVGRGSEVIGSEPESFLLGWCWGVGQRS